MTAGLVLGKFAPLHLGHQSLIEGALEQVDTLYVLVYDAPSVTRIPLAKRATWIRELHPSATVIEGRGAPEASGRDPQIMRAQERYIMSVVPSPITHFFSGEWYGDHVSRALGAHDIRVDEARRRFPVSGTMLRSDPKRYRQFVHPRVYQDLVRRVVLLGAESTGKTSLAARLASAFDTVWVPEFGRDYWLAHRGPDGRLSSTQLGDLAEGHRQREDALGREANRLLIVDTDARTTRQYARWYHGGTVEPHLQWRADTARERADLTVLCGDDFAYVEDGTRAGEPRRIEAQGEIRLELKAGSGTWIEVRGPIQERVELVRSAITRFEILPWY